MRKNLIFTIIVIIVAVAICWFIKKPNQITSVHATATNEDSTTASNAVTPQSIISTQKFVAIVQVVNGSSNENNTIVPELVLVKYKSIEDLKQIKSLKSEGKYPGLEDWVSEGHMLAFQINGIGGKPMVFNADFVSALTDTSDGHVHQLDLHSPRMSIDQIREIGLQLNAALGLDSTSFLAWCDKVGNKWLDQPLFSSGGTRVPDSNQFYGFGIHRTLDNEKPWYILFFITDP